MLSKIKFAQIKKEKKQKKLNKISENTVSFIPFDEKPMLDKSYCFSKDIYLGQDRCCAKNAMVNRKIFFAGKNLKLKTGHLRISKTIEIGYKDEKDLHKLAKNFQKGDFHCWLEDDEGNVYDNIQGNWVDTLRMQNVKPKFTKNMRFEKQPKKELAKIGLEYNSYDEFVCKVHEELFEETYKNILDMLNFVKV